MDYQDSTVNKSGEKKDEKERLIPCPRLCGISWGPKNSLIYFNNYHFFNKIHILDDSDEEENKENKEEEDQTTTTTDSNDDQNSSQTTIERSTNISTNDLLKRRYVRT